ncbi:MAG TPA: dienelactone hydrolase family protein [Anaerolineales bacterium]|nr:dienelactone hydrolase family protein [Anaerolineales bacterium]
MVFRVFKGILIGLLGLAAFAVLIAGGLIAMDSLSPTQQAADFANVTYPGADGAMLYAYLAQPAGSSPLPGIVLIHSFYGLDEETVEKADLLAQHGYSVLAVDAYRGRSTTQLPRAIWLSITTPQEQVGADIGAGFSYLSHLKGVDPQRIGAVGFCFGGTQAMRLGMRNPALAANVIFYGSSLVTEPGKMGSLGAGGPVLGIFGADDRMIPLDEVWAFESAMVERGLAHRVSVYPGVGHAFVNMETLSRPGPAQEAWDEMLVFLEEVLKAPSSSR